MNVRFNRHKEWWVSERAMLREERKLCVLKIKNHSPNCFIDEDTPEHGTLRNNINFIWIRFSDDADEAEFIMLVSAGVFDDGWRI
jgi:hypothetical protein